MQRTDSKTNPIVLIALLIGLILVIVGVSTPFLRLPIMGDLKLEECRGANSLSIWIGVGLLIVGFVGLIFNGRGAILWGLVSLAGAGLFVGSLVRLGLYLADMIEQYRESGALVENSEDFLKLGCWLLIAGLVLTVFSVFLNWGTRLRRV